MAPDLDEGVDEFRNRRLDAGQYRCHWIDGVTNCGS